MIDFNKLNIKGPDREKVKRASEVLNQRNTKNLSLSEKKKLLKELGQDSDSLTPSTYNNQPTVNLPPHTFDKTEDQASFGHKLPSTLAIQQLSIGANETVSNSFSSIHANASSAQNANRRNTIKKLIKPKAAAKNVGDTKVLATNSYQTDSNQVSNLNNDLNKEGANGIHREHKQGAMGVQKGFIENTKDMQTGFNLGTNRVQLKDAIRVHEIERLTHSKEGANSIHRGYKESANQSKTEDQSSALEELSGSQLKIVLYIYRNILINETVASSLISTSQLSKELHLTVNTVKSSIARLIKKDILARHKSLVGRNKGATSFLLCDRLKRSFKLNFNLQEIESHIISGKITTRHINSLLEVNGDANRVQKEGANFSSSSSSNINTTTTEHNSEWDQVQIPSALKSLNFGPHLIKQVRERELLSPLELQKSLEAFAFDICENDLINSKKIMSPISYFMSIANRKTQYAPSTNFVSDEFKALESNKERLDKLKKQREDQELINSELAFEEWLYSLNLDDKTRLVPEEDYLKVGSSFHTKLLKSHFLNALNNGVSPND